MDKVRSKEREIKKKLKHHVNPLSMCVTINEIYMWIEIENGKEKESYIQFS